MSVQSTCNVSIIDDPKIIKNQFSPNGKPFLRLKFDDVTVDITTNLAEMIGGVGAGARRRWEDKQ